MAKPRRPKNEDQKPDNSTGVVQHQKLCLSIDMDNRRVYGYTELKVLVPESGVVGLHADNMVIDSVLVDGEVAEFQYSSHYQIPDDEMRFSSISSASSASDAACLSYMSSLEKEFTPNLVIFCGKEVKNESDQHVDTNARSDEQLSTEVGDGGGERDVSGQEDKKVESDKQEDTKAENEETNPENGSQSSAESNQNVKTIRIDYWVEKLETGIHYENNVLHTDNQIRRAHCWFPCMDNSSQLCSFDMEFTVAQKFVAVSNGTLLYQVLSKDDPPRITFVYKLSVPVTAGWISLVVAQFQILPDRHSGLLSHMCLSLDYPKLRNTVAFFHCAFSHYEDYLSAPFPFGSYKQVFIAPEVAISSLSVGASLSIFSSQVLFDEKVIDQTIDTRIKLAYALARQWFGVYITADGPNDEWLLDGLAGFLTDSFIKRFLGNNEARYRRYKANCTVCKADVSGAFTLSSTASSNLYGTQCVGLYGKIRSWKSVAILQMLEKQMGPESFRKILQVIVLRAQDTSRSLRTLSTKEFRHFSNKVGNLERPFLKEFFPRWVGCCGCPVLRLGFSYNKRKNMIELAVLRGCTAAQDSVTLDSNNPDAETREGDTGWPGMMSIRVYELDGMYDHPILPMSGEDLQLIEIQCHSRLAAKRIQKPKKGSKPDGSDDNGDNPTLDLRPNAESPLLWLRADPEMEYLAEIHFSQPVQMWINQLEKDKDVAAQAQAIATLEALPQFSFSVVNALYNFLSDSKAFWRVRIDAAFALAHTASEDTDWAGLLHLVKFYKSRRFDENIGLPRPNDFRDFSEYFVLEAIPHAIAMVRAADKSSPREAVEFVLQLLKYNDNNGNPYSDVYWLAALVQSIGELEFGNQSILFLSSLLKRIDRLLQFDRLMPSYNGILTISCIRSLTQIALKLSALISLDPVSKLIQPFRGCGISWKVRIEASRALLDLEFHCNGTDAALLLFIRYLEEESTLRGQVKLAVHVLRLCQIRCESEVEDEIKESTLMHLLHLLESRKSFCNILLRHHLFCLFQVIAGRPPTLYGIPRTHVRPPEETETVRGQITEAAFMNLEISIPPEPPGDAQKPSSDALPIPEAHRGADTVSNGSEGRRIVFKPLVDAQHPSPDVLNIPEGPRDADTISNASERRRTIVKIRVKHSAASSRADEAENVYGGRSRSVQDEAERGCSSSMSVDAPVRISEDPLNVTCQIIEDVNSFHDHDSRVTASIGSAKLANEDETKNELQCTADSRKVDYTQLLQDKSSPNIVRNNGVEHAAHKYASLQTLTTNEGPLMEDPDLQKKEKKKDKDKKRKREKDRSDPKYLEKKRLKKEKKQREKELKKLQSMSSKLPSTASLNPNVETRSKSSPCSGDSKAISVEQGSGYELPRVASTLVYLKPNEPSGSNLVSRSVETKGEAKEGSSAKKIRIKLKHGSLKKS